MHSSMRFGCTAECGIVSRAMKSDPIAPGHGEIGRSRKRYAAEGYGAQAANSGLCRNYYNPG
jgi:hypothetical protein